MIETRKNMSFEVTNPLTNEKMTIWDSRSCSVAMFCFAKDKNGEWYILSTIRGDACPDYKGYWCCPCGYLEWNETEYFAAVRETFEETGIIINENNIVKYKSSADPLANRQNVSFVFYTILPETVEYYQSNLTTKFIEPNEVSCVEFVCLPELGLEFYYNWAFGHKEIIREIFNKRIKLSFFKKMILKLYNKYF